MESEKNNDPKEQDQQTDDEITKRISTVINAVVDQQIAENNPPETLVTYERLLDEGFEKKEVYQLIGKIVSCETAEMIVNGQEFNMERYVTALQALPKPFAEEKQNDEDDD